MRLLFSRRRDTIIGKNNGRRDIWRNLGLRNRIQHERNVKYIYLYYMINNYENIENEMTE